MPCPICLQTYTSKARKEVKCQYCPEAACLPCMQQYLLSSVEDSHCFTCKRGWTTEFMNNNFPMSFRGKTLRMHRRSVLLSREKSSLPAMQVFVEAKRNYNNALETVKVLTNDFEPIRTEYMRLLGIEMTKKRNYQIALYNTDRLTNFEKVTETRIEYRTAVDKTTKYKKDHYTKMHRVMKAACRQLARLERIYETGETDGEEPTRREFLMRCPGEECRGFISSSYICGTCTKKTCSDCIEIIEEGHVCKPESIESAKAIKKETRACPKCAARIFKIDGCDQMWCTMDGCNTAFSWNTGHIVSGRVHNPHYYEWLRQNGGAGPEREAGDIPCGGLPNQRLFIYRILDNQALSEDEKNRLLEINRCLAEFEWRLQGYPARMAALANKDINVKYLMNQISEAEWQRQLEFTEMRFIRKKEIGQILQTLVTVSADIMASIYERAEIVEGAEWIRSSGLPNLESLREYTTKTLVNLGNTMRIAVPTISDIWHWNPTRIHYKKKVGVVDAAEVPPLDYDARGEDTDEEIPVDVEAI